MLWVRFRDSLIPLAVFIPVKRTSKTSETFKSLLLSLCISDLGVGFLIQPLYVAYLTMEITKNSKKTDNIIAYWAVVKAYAIPHSWFVFASFFGVFAITVDRFLAIHLHNLRYRKLHCDSQTGCCCSDLILGVQCNCLLLVWIDKCFVRGVSCLYHNHRIALLQDIRSRKTPHKPDSRSASTWTSRSEWRHGKYRKAEKNCRCYILHVYLVFNFSYL